MQVSRVPLPPMPAELKQSHRGAETVSARRPSEHLAKRARRAPAAFKDYTTEVSEGMVVLDAVHQIQAEQAPDLACRWNCKAGKCGSCSAEINGKPRLMCMTPPQHARPRRAGHRRADAGVPADQGPGHRRVVELPRQEGPQDVQAAPAGARRRHVADGAERRRSRPGIPQVHRVLPVPGRLPRAARSRQARGVHRAALLRLRRGARDAPARHRRPPRRT